MSHPDLHIAIIGSGNAANSLARAFAEKGSAPKTIFSRNKKEGQQLARQIDAAYGGPSLFIPKETNLVLICVSDRSIREVSDAVELEDSKTIVAHTSGSMPLDHLDKHSNRGVFYPVQTLRKNHPTDFSQVPLCLNAANAKTLKVLQKLASGLTHKVFLLDDTERKKVHLAAVVVNNFTNHLLAQSYAYLEEHSIPTETVKELFRETCRKLLAMPPDLTQTGPAARRDQVVIREHLAMLEGNELQPLYEAFSTSIMKTKES